MLFLINLVTFGLLVLMWNLVNLAIMAALGYHYAKSSIIDSLPGCMELSALLLTLQWSIPHGLNPILKAFGEFQNVPSESILLVILQDFRFIILCFSSPPFTIIVQICLV